MKDKIQDKTKTHISKCCGADIEICGEWGKTQAIFICLGCGKILNENSLILKQEKDSG